MMKQVLVTILCLMYVSTVMMAQLVNFTAKDTVPVYQDHFRPGVNMGYYPPYSDDDLANIAAGNPALGITGAGVKAARPGLFDSFTSVWGYDSRLLSYQHFYNLGLRDMTCIVGFPADWNREHVSYCATDTTIMSDMFAGIYNDIWDDGTDGTPYNDNNLYAAYLYEVVSRYGPYVKFWEIWNEPGFDYTFATGWQLPGTPNNWWDFNPNPCDYKLRAPIFHYIRTLRISWEIIKTIDPDAYVCVAGVGFTSFLDAILRNTDNPIDGSATTAYPHGGGAYFDVMGFHSYPDIDGTVRYWDNSIGGFVYTRHSDSAAEGIERRQTSYQGVLDNYGFDGVTYPKKEWIITEINIPRQAFGAGSIGDQDAQLNYIMKSYVKANEFNIRQMHLYNLVDIETEQDADYEYDLMGLYSNVTGTTPYTTLQMNPEGIAYKTCSDLLFEKRFDPVRTNALNLPPEVDGGAFFDATTGLYTYCLWAKTTIDLSEAASEVYSFPLAWNFGNLERRVWDYSQNGFMSMVPAQGIGLDARPIFLTETAVTNVPLTASFNADVTSGCIPMTVQYTDESVPNIGGWSWTFEGGTPATDTTANPSVVYNTPGTYEVTLEVSDPSGTTINVFTQTSYITVEAMPTTDFVINNNNTTTINLFNSSTGATSYLWDFGDGDTSIVANPSHTYAMDGAYNISLTATNDCGSTTAMEIVTVQSLIAPQAGFTSDLMAGCDTFVVQFTDTSINMPDTWEWIFAGGTPSTSNDQNPIVTYTTPGVYTVVLQAGNAAGNGFVAETDYIVVGTTPVANFTSTVADSTVTFDNFSTSATSYLWDFGDGNASTDIEPTHTYAADGSYLVELNATNTCGSVTVSNMVTIQTLMSPVPSFIADTLSGCTPLTVQFMDQSTNSPTSWTWSFSSAATPSISYDQNPIVTFHTAGVHDVILQAGNGIGDNTIIEEGYITVDPTATADFTYSMNGGNINFINLSQDGDTYFWDFGDGDTSNVFEPSHSYMQDGTYNVNLVVTNSCDEVATMQTINVSGVTIPVADFNVSHSDTICAPLVVQFNDQSLNTPTGWYWTFPGGTPANSEDQNPVVTYTSAGVYNVSLSVSNPTGVNSIEKEQLIVVHEDPVPDFSAIISGDSVYFTNTSIGGGGVSWDFGDSNYSTDDSPLHKYSAYGTYTVALTAYNDCGFEIISKEVVLANPTAVEELDQINNFQLFPNPNNGQFTMILDGESIKDLSVNIYNILGQVVHTEMIDFNTGHLTKGFDISRLASGTYFVQLNSEEGTLTRKLVKN